MPQQQGYHQQLSWHFRPSIFWTTPWPLGDQRRTKSAQTSASLQYSSSTQATNPSTSQTTTFPNLPYQPPPQWWPSSDGGQWLCTIPGSHLQVHHCYYSFHTTLALTLLLMHSLLHTFLFHSALFTRLSSIHFLIYRCSLPNPQYLLPEHLILLEVSNHLHTILFSYRYR